MEAFKVRLVNEHFELTEKIGKLKPFITSENFQKVEPKQQELLKKQVVAMEEYADILQERLELLGVK